MLQRPRSPLDRPGILALGVDVRSTNSITAMGALSP